MTETEQRLLDVKQVAHRYGVSRETIWSWMRKRLFPQPHRITPRCSRWPVAELDAFDAERERERLPRHAWEQRYGRTRRPPMRRTRWNPPR